MFMKHPDKMKENNISHVERVTIEERTYIK